MKKLLLEMTKTHILNQAVLFQVLKDTYNINSSINFIKSTGFISEWNFSNKNILVFDFIRVEFDFHLLWDEGLYKSIEPNIFLILHTQEENVQEPCQQNHKESEIEKINLLNNGDIRKIVPLPKESWQFKVRSNIGNHCYYSQQYGLNYVDSSSSSLK